MAVLGWVLGSLTTVWLQPSFKQVLEVVKEFMMHLLQSPLSLDVYESWEIQQFTFLIGFSLLQNIDANLNPF
jgi:hypothetical protein